MMQDITHRHEYDNLMIDIPIYDWKNLKLADWLLQIEKVALLTHSQEYELATAKGTSMSYEMLKRIGNKANWQEIKRKLEDVYSLQPHKYTMLVTYTKNKDQRKHYRNTCKILWTWLKSNGSYSANITNCVIIFLFIKNVYNKDIRWWVAGAKTISTLADSFKLAHHSLLKFKKYEGLVYNDKHAIAEINQITETLTNINVGNRPKPPEKALQNKTNKSYTFWGNYWKCGKFGHSAKECQDSPVTANQDQTMVTTFKNTQNGLKKLQIIEPIKYPTTISPTRLPTLTQQIMVDFQLSQEAWNKLSSQMNEMAETN